MPLIIKPKSANLTKGREHLFFKIDPYLICKLGPQSFTTKVDKRAGKQPQWSDTFQFRDPTMGSEMLVLLYDKDKLSRDDLIGEGRLFLGKVMNNPGRVDSEYVDVRDREGNVVGRVLFQLQFLPTVSQMNFNNSNNNNSMMYSNSNNLNPNLNSFNNPNQNLQMQSTYNNNNNINRPPLTPSNTSSSSSINNPYPYLNSNLNNQQMKHSTISTSYSSSNQNHNHNPNPSINIINQNQPSVYNYSSGSPRNIYQNQNQYQYQNTGNVNGNGNVNAGMSEYRMNNQNKPIIGEQFPNFSKNNR